SCARDADLHTCPTRRSSDLGDVTVNEFNMYADANALKDAAGDGVGVLQAVQLLAKGGPIGFIRSNASVAGAVNQTRGVFTEDGTAGAVTHDPDTGEGPLITVDAANATRSCSVDIVVTTGGALGTVAVT